MRQVVQKLKGTYTHTQKHHDNLMSRYFHENRKAGKETPDL
jgi:hypothetical protein